MLKVVASVQSRLVHMKVQCRGQSSSSFPSLMAAQVTVYAGGRNSFWSKSQAGLKCTRWSKSIGSSWLFIYTQNICSKLVFRLREIILPKIIEVRS